MKIYELIFLLAALVFDYCPSARSQELAEASVVFPVSIGTSVVRLEGLVVRRADAQGRLPVAMIGNGGVAATSGLDGKASNFAPWARDMARRGWLAVVVMRRGFGQSEGSKPNPLPCDSRSFDAWASLAADDLQATMDLVARRPDADPDKVIMIGNLSAGAAAVALSARNPRGLRAVISVSGAVLADAKCSMADILVSAYQEFGKKSRVPNLWLYSNSDIVFPPDLSDRLHTAFLDAGGDVKFVLFNHEGDVGNGLFGGARRIWFAQMDAFLRAQQLPTWTRADLLDVAKKMGIASPAAQEELFSYLGENYFPAPGEKAWAISATPTPDGSLPPDGYGLGADTIDRARQTALATCQKQVPRCVVMENNRWVGATP